MNKCLKSSAKIEIVDPLKISINCIDTEDSVTDIELSN